MRRRRWRRPLLGRASDRAGAVRRHDPDGLHYTDNGRQTRRPPGSGGRGPGNARTRREGHDLSAAVDGPSQPESARPDPGTTMLVYVRHRHHHWPTDWSQYCQPLEPRFHRATTRTAASLHPFDARSAVGGYCRGSVLHQSVYPGPGRLNTHQLPVHIRHATQTTCLYQFIMA